VISVTNARKAVCDEWLARQLDLLCRLPNTQEHNHEL
jgi:hypothetical protein